VLLPDLKVVAAINGVIAGAFTSGKYSQDEIQVDFGFRVSRN